MKDQLSRRTFMNGTLGLAIAATAGFSSNGAMAAGANPAPSPLTGEAMLNAKNEAYWEQIASQYKVSPDFVNLENGYYGMMAKPVLEAYERNIEALNQTSSYFLRRDYDPKGQDAVRAQVAALAGVSPDEIAITRGATEALQNLIANYKLLSPGDTVMYADLDYPSMQYVMNHLKAQRGVNVATFNIPEPASKQAILDAYAKAMAANPKTRLLLLTHVSHRTGLVMPIADIANMARARNIDVIVDAAHSWGHLDFNIPDLQVDFAGFNLHKWMGAPLGVGFMYIRKERLQDIDLQYGDEDYPPNDIRSRVHSGTTNTANVMTVPTALALHAQIGGANKAARLRYLRDYWVSRVKKFNGVRILTPDDPSLYGAITSFRLEGKNSKADNLALANQLREQYKIFTVQRGGMASGDCVRVTPCLANRTADLDRLVAALKEISRS